MLRLLLILFGLIGLGFVLGVKYGPTRQEPRIAVADAPAIMAEPPPAAPPPPPTPADARSLTARVQEALQARGYDPGPADGIAGPRTRAAITAFEAAEGLPQTGEASATLLERLTAE